MNYLIYSALLAVFLSACGGSAKRLPEAFLGDWYDVEQNDGTVQATIYKNGDYFFIQLSDIEIPLEYDEEEKVLVYEPRDGLSREMRIFYIPETGNIKCNTGGESFELRKLSEREGAELKENNEGSS